MEGSRMHGTTILCVKRNGSVVVGGDGQVTLGSTIMKSTAEKVRYVTPRVLAGFAGHTSDALTLLDNFQQIVERHEKSGLTKACIEFAKFWRTDRVLRRLEAMLLVADKMQMFVLSGTGDIIEPESDVIAIGSGSVSAQSAAKALLLKTKMSARNIVEVALSIAASTCVYTNDKITIFSLGNS